jgi:hypothetical protein
MFMGADIAEGLSESVKQNRRMSNVFGMGYEDDERATVGCSFKGRRPEGFQDEPEDKVVLELDAVTTELFDCDIVPVSREITGPLQVRVSAEDKAAVFEVVFSADSAQFKQVSGASAYGQVRGGRRPLVELFNEDPPIIHFANGDFLVFNELFELPRAAERVSFDAGKATAWLWKGVDLKKESQGPEKDATSIQRHTLERILGGEFGAWEIVFDGDGKGYGRTLALQVFWWRSRWRANRRPLRGVWPSAEMRSLARGAEAHAKAPSSSGRREDKIRKK